MQNTSTYEVESRLNKIKLEDEDGAHASSGVDIHALPEELLLEIVKHLFVSELKELKQNDKLAKFQLVDRIRQRFDELKSVCKRWDRILNDSATFILKKILYQLIYAGVSALIIRSQHFSKEIVIMAKLRDNIFVFPYLSFSVKKVDVYGEDFQLKTSVHLDGIRLVSSCVVAHGCLYFADSSGIWKITPDDFKPTHWLDLDYETSISVSKDGNLLVSHWYKPEIKVYGQNAEVLRSIKLPNRVEKMLRSSEIMIKEKRNGNLDVFQTNSILEISADGELLRDQPLSSDIFTFCALLDSDDHIIMTDYLCEQLYIFDLDLQCCHKISLRGRLNAPTDGGIYCASNILYDEDKNVMYVALKLYK